MDLGLRRTRLPQKDDLKPFVFLLGFGHPADDEDGKAWAQLAQLADEDRATALGHDVVVTMTFICAGSERRKADAS
jgi:uncharacterized protein YegL